MVVLFLIRVAVCLQHCKTKQTCLRRGSTVFSAVLFIQNIKRLLLGGFVENAMQIQGQR